MRPLAVVVVGHTNTGKTSLMRTLIRDVGFGEVSDRPATTRHVEGASLLVGDTPLLTLYDTPGLEDSIGLLEHLDGLRTDRETAWVDVVAAFLESPAAHGRFEQEAKALRQVLAGDAALYVIDARDRVLGKYRDELEILGRCARPVVPVLNFVASPDARINDWRAALTRVNMHAIVVFDTVAVDADSERRLFEALRTLLEPFRATLDLLIAERARLRTTLIRSAAEVVADLLVDVAAYTVTVPEHGEVAAAEAALRQVVRQREQACVDTLLALFRFRAEDHDGDALPLENGQWGLDLFNPESLKRFGVRAGGGAAAGGLAGLAVDAMTGGLSLGAAAALGATAGALWSSFETHGRRVADLLRGYTELRVAPATLRLLAVRQIALVQALLHRGHASQARIRAEPTATATATALGTWAEGKLPDALAEARFHAEWSRLHRVGPGQHQPMRDDPERAVARDAVAHAVAAALTEGSV